VDVAAFEPEAELAVAKFDQLGAWRVAVGAGFQRVFCPFLALPYRAWCSTGSSVPPFARSYSQKIAAIAVPLSNVAGLARSAQRSAIARAGAASVAETTIIDAIHRTTTLESP
jgi:hypothetical protein